MLDDRKTAILRAVVQEYVATGLPVGSSHIANLPAVKVSSATIRNEMAALEQEGYLAQPHTSAGRIPPIRATAISWTPLLLKGCWQRKRQRK
jgi:heat-inducible transcriptional repressor